MPSASGFVGLFPVLIPGVSGFDSGRSCSLLPVLLVCAGPLFSLYFNLKSFNLQKFSGIDRFHENHQNRISGKSWEIFKLPKLKKFRPERKNLPNISVLVRANSQEGKDIDHVPSR